MTGSRVESTETTEQIDSGWMLVATSLHIWRTLCDELSWKK